jgi:hypothetical protein
VSPDPRDELARQQQALVAALTANAQAPPDFDSTQVATAAAALAKKRMHTAAKGWPALADAMGEQFEPLFQAYASRHVLPVAGHIADARHFLTHVLRQGNLDDETMSRLLPLRCTRACPVRFRTTRDGVVVIAVRLGRRVIVRRISLRRRATPANVTRAKA